MADLAITAANVAKGSGAIVADGTAGETITAGKVVYLKSSDTRMWLAQNDGTLEEATAIGIALHAASAGQPLKYQTDGIITIGGTVGTGKLYYLSATAGGMTGGLNVTTSQYVTIVGIAASTTTLLLHCRASGAQLAGAAADDDDT